MEDFYPVKGFSPERLGGCTVIVPSVSLANLPQLAADLLIESLHLKRIGWIGKGDTGAPFVGAGDNGEGIITGGLEVYGEPGSHVVVIQQRSPTLKSRKDAHTQLLHDFLTSHDFAFILILASLDAASQDDAQLLTPHQHIVPPTSSSSSSKHVDRLTSLLPPLNLSLSETPITLHSSKQYPPFLPAAGLTRRLLSSLNETEQAVPHGAITAWCVEGDNRGDAHALAKVALAVLDQGGYTALAMMDQADLRVEGVEVKEPRSWAGLFGARNGWSGGFGDDAELYG